MVTIRKMDNKDVPILYNIALRAFQPDFEKHGIYPPLIQQSKQKFLPPLIFGKVLLVEDTIIGGAFVVGLGKKGELGSIFIDPLYQRQGYGKEAMILIEQLHPKVKKWKLDVLSGNYHLHTFYESLGYQKVGEMKVPKSDLTGFIYEKNL